jgi:hypothetical protein
MRWINDTVRAEIAKQVEQAVAERVGPLQEALERISAQMLEHNAAVEAARAEQAAAADGALDPAQSGWFQPRGDDLRPEAESAAARESAEIAQQIQHLAEQRLHARQRAVTQRCARIQHRMAARGAR